ncbi:MAG: hypothetical protein B7Z37_29055 [Verrucomicrobia bacterium 12-59-8]|nr:MAG: hypothetical protein B7Z37_29055 [Verrucomicrobia bacterium 12-59-8]
MLLPGVSLSQGVSEITGVAISPLLGVSVMGVWTYYKTEPHLRHRLPWYCHPGVWGTGLGLIVICFLKDFLGTAAPPLVKKPLDFLELFENKLSALVATIGFVPLVALAMAQYNKIQPQAVNGLADSGLAVMPLASVIDFGVHTPWISIPVAIVAFGVVWLSSHAINVLIALSPFGIVDAGLKLIKLGLMALVAGSTLIHPYAGAAVSLVLILIGLLFAGWSFRLTLFGTLMGSDFLLNKRASPADVESGVKGFLARRTEGVPVRTMVRLKQDAAGRPVLSYHPWLVLPERRIAVADADMVICKGLVHPSLAHRPAETSAALRSTLILLPRYRRLEDTIARHFGCQEVVDGALMRGFKAMRQWLVEMLSSGRKLVEMHPG